MSRSSNREDFFQTTTSLEESDRKAAKSHNKFGQPIKLPSKILAIASGPRDARLVYVADSTGTVRRVSIEAGKVTAVFKGPSAPLSSVCLSLDGKLVLAGCWDKLVWSWDTETREVKKQFSGHLDFVKSVISTRLGGKEVLISGGADNQIIVFDVNSGEKLYVLKGHTRAIQDLAIDPLQWGQDQNTIHLFSAGSEREIRQFLIPPPSQDESNLEPLLHHETSVYKLFFDADGDLWTASADNTAKCLIRDRKWQPDLILEHPDFVRDVIVSERGGWVMTACRDEEVRVWNRATGELYHTFSGHFEEVTGLALVDSTLISVSIDATIRQWSLLPSNLERAREVARNQIQVEPTDSQPVSILTEEEERELAELLEGDA